MIKYKSKYKFDNSIEKVSVVSETEHFVTIEYNDFRGFQRTQREKKLTEYDAYFDTFEEAKNFLINDSEQKLNQIRLSLQREQGRLGNIKGMKES